MIIYTYRNYGELISTTGEINSQYSYDSRGNMLTKTTDGETTVFSYANSEWQDQLTSVNDTQLTYDANGNLVSDGRYEYQWSGSKTLETITDGENTYSYKYFNGIRSVKTINGVSTEINEKNGVVLSQSDGTNHLYFQYVNSVPFGFVYNDVQYFYITNLNGDVIGITDAEGNLIAQYAYDEWGKLLSIDAENEENRAVAEINPLRYRGYYYDNETGLYYLQSRYYNPEWCRFISADGFDYLSTSNHRTSNAYIYCWNNPIVLDDAEGTASKISIDLEKIWAFVVKGYNKIVSKFEERFEKFAVKVNAFAEKAKYYSDNPGALFKKVITDFETLTNKTLSFILGQEISLKFKMLEWLKENVSFETSLTEEDDSGISLYSSRKVNYDSNAGSTISIIITEMFTCFDLITISKAMNYVFKFDDLYDYLEKKVDVYRKAFDEGIVNLGTAAKSFASTLSDKLSSVMGFIDKLPDEISAAFAALPIVMHGINDYSGRYLSPIGSMIVAFVDFIVDSAIYIGSEVISAFVSPFWGNVFGLSYGKLYDVLETRQKAEFLAYNWYYIFMV